ncbi:hypothetical protein HDU99_004480 [Rhizoclosmatium hyalinum]|nr:hypothetical protein HDU99_004480 [Rhizoclosmatium hyalinum]
MDVSSVIPLDVAASRNAAFEAMIADSVNWPVQSTRVEYLVVNNVTVRRRASDGQWIASGPIPHSLETAIRLLTETETRLKWDIVMDNYVTLGKVDYVLENGYKVAACLTHTRLAPAARGMISSRDFVDASLIVGPGDADVTNKEAYYSLIWQSLDAEEHKDLLAKLELPPAKHSNAAQSIRGINHLGGGRVSLREGMDGSKECWMDYCCRSEIKGSVPGWLVDMGTGGALESVFVEIRKVKNII